MKILVVDDSALKIASISEEICLVLGTDVAIETAGSVAECLAKLRSTAFDLMILDLSLPRRGGLNPETGGGLSVLTEMSRGVLNVPQHVIGLTAHAEIAAEQREQFDRAMWTLLIYDATSSEWARRLSVKLAHISAARSTRGGGGYDADVCIITAVEALEHKAVLELPGPWSKFKVEGDGSHYYRAEWDGGGVARKVVAGCVLDMGMASAAAFAMKCIYQFRPRYLVMCGIAAGFVGEVGDLLIADAAWDYASGKTVPKGKAGVRVARSPKPLQIEFGVRASLAYFNSHGGAKSKIRSAWCGMAPPLPPAFHLGPIASGPTVVAASALSKEVKEQHRKMVGIDMEAYAVLMAAYLCSEPVPRVIVAKGISDRADEEKDDDHQEYAAFVSARYIYELVCSDALVF